MNESLARENLFRQQLRSKIMILDGAMGTMLQRANLTAQDFGGEEYEGCNELLNLYRPDVVRAIHDAYLEAGADIIETNTFGATRVVLSDYGVEDKDMELNRLGAQIAKQAAAAWSTPQQPRFVAGSMGPTNKMLSLTGGITFDQLVEDYYRQAKALLEGGVDLLLIETAQDTLNVKAAGIGVRRALAEVREVPVMISGTIEPMGTTLAGQTVDAFYISLEHFNPIAIGINCATGPEFMRDHLRSLAEIAQCAVSCYPNAGLPDEEGHYHESPESFAHKVAAFAESGWLNIAGGCCGTTPDHIRALTQTLKNYRPREFAGKVRVSAVSGLEAVYVEEENRPLLVGERTNVIGSKKFRELIAAGHYEEAAEIARAQVRKGAHVVDICLANPDRDEYQDLANFLPHVTKKVKAPLMFDSTDPRVVELGLKHCQGKALINSINLEEGLRRFAEMAPLIKNYGAAVVVGMIDEQGMALTRQRKLEIARRSYDILVNQMGIPPQDLIFDPLVFPVGTGDEQYLGAARETIEGLRLIKNEFPQCKTLLGISNVSFGLPPAGREVVNAVFLYHATKAGLDYAIVNAEKLKRYPSIPEEERQLAEELLFNTSDEVIAKFAEFYRQRREAAEESSLAVELPLEERLKRYIIEGRKDGLEDDLVQALNTYKPLELINGPLLEGMAEVGRLFNANQLIVAEVLQSAEVMKAAVAFLEPHMEKQETAVKGKVLLATVKGDVHDIGKNLVGIILANNGYQVIDLGIKVSSEQIIEAVQREQPQFIGLSGLLVKSAQQMVATAQDLRSAGISLPLVVGGAALTQKFAETRIAPEYGGQVYYAQDAMAGLDVLNSLQK